MFLHVLFHAPGRLCARIEWVSRPAACRGGARHGCWCQKSLLLLKPTLVHIFLLQPCLLASPLSGTMADSAKASKIAEGRRLLTIASSSKSTPSQRLAFHRFLLSLRSTSSFEDKAYFAQNIARYFPEFEDLQDEAIDGLLDLCEDEDERARMEGIKGLGETGRVEPRWVKGNAGVLLQLLACRWSTCYSKQKGS